MIGIAIVGTMFIVVMAVFVLALVWFARRQRRSRNNRIPSGRWAAGIGLRRHGE
jgi:heme/copper-type cytochrome/quinol oxidase subunit 2